MAHSQPNVSQLRKVTAPLNGGVFINPDGSIVFHAFHNKHLIFPIAALGFIIPAYYVSWWFLIGTPITLIWLLNRLIRRKKASALRLDFKACEMRRGERVVSLVDVAPDDFQVEDKGKTAVIHCLHPRFEMTLPVKFQDILQSDFDKDGYGSEHLERAEAFCALLREYVAESVRLHGGKRAQRAQRQAEAAENKPTKGKDKKKRLSETPQDRRWMLHPANILMPAWGLMPAGIGVRSLHGETEDTATELLARYGVTDAESALLAFGNALQDIHSRLAVLQPLALLPASAQQGYLDYLHAAADELIAEEEARPALPGILNAAPDIAPNAAMRTAPHAASETAPSDNFLLSALNPAGPEFSKVLELAYNKEGPALVNGYAQLLRQAEEAGVLGILAEVEAAATFQAQVYGTVSLISAAARLTEAYGEENYRKATDPFTALLRKLGAKPADQAALLIRLRDIKKLRRALIDDEDFAHKELLRLETLASPESAVLLNRNPYLAWDYAKAVLLRRLSFTLGFETNETALWADLRPFALRLQKTVGSWQEVYFFLLKGQVLSGSDEFGTTNAFTRTMAGRITEQALNPESLPWKTRLKA